MYLLICLLLYLFLEMTSQIALKMYEQITKGKSRMKHRQPVSMGFCGTRSPQATPDRILVEKQKQQVQRTHKDSLMMLEQAWDVRSQQEDAPQSSQQPEFISSQSMRQKKQPMMWQSSARNKMFFMIQQASIALNVFSAQRLMFLSNWETFTIFMKMMKLQAVWQLCSWFTATCRIPTIRLIKSIQKQALLMYASAICLRSVMTMPLRMMQVLKLKSMSSTSTSSRIRSKQWYRTQLSKGYS